MNTGKQFITGAEVAAQAAKDAGAEMMYGYPITPATEIFAHWIKSGGKSLQTEDEIAAGFAVCGGVLAGQKCFTASSGPGNILMQDSLSMAEGMRLPFVMIVAQRGGPSSGTVIYSQQEVILSCFGGNGEGHRLVYSPSNLEELYFLTRQAFNDAWQYRFPAIVLTDGYMLKAKGVVGEIEDKIIDNIKAEALVTEDRVVNLHNIFTAEEELYEDIMEARRSFHEIAKQAANSEAYLADDADLLIITHGIVASGARMAVDELRRKGKKAGLFRPVTLRPFDRTSLDKYCGRAGVKKILVVESSLGQLARVVRDQLAPEIGVGFAYLQNPGLGIEVEDMVKEAEKYC
jgi:2-oxoglutarate/2-oxoacid ferredoxin oxidoreductase subunit alpha